MTRAIAPAVVLAVAIVAALALGSAAVAVVTGAVALVAVSELYALMRGAGRRPVPLAGFVGVAALVGLAYAYGERAPQIFPAAVAGTLVFIGATLVVLRRVAGSVEAAAASLLGVVYVGVLVSYVVVLRRMPFGTRLVVALVAYVVANDAVSSVVRRLVRPPHDAWASLAAGTVATLVAAIVIATTSSPPFDAARALLLGVVVCAAAPAGRMTWAMLESDGGTAAHAPVLRRIDGMLLAAPLFFYAYRVLAR